MQSADIEVFMDQLNPVAIDQDSSLENLTDYAGILQQKIDFAKVHMSEREDEEQRKREERAQHLISINGSAYEFMIDHDLLLRIAFDNYPIKMGLFKRLFKIPPGATVYITTSFHMEFNWYFIYLDLISILNIMRSRGIKLVFRLNNSCDFIDMHIASLCNEVRVERFGFLMLGFPPNFKQVTDTMKDMFVDNWDTITAFMIEKKFITKDELDKLIDRPKDNCILLTGADLLDRVGETTSQ